ncbi:hypothetical protein C8R46DRAFT_334108 [Mycena filopes]|nr:hypothetical protein C8R46DRAFT_334108 [Mycena filopes]
MVDALYTAVLHHRIAAQAGVLHRDISDGNVLLQEGPASDASKGFLVDWDYAEFIDKGLENFQTWFPERKDEEAKYIAADRSLKDMTGTIPFIAIAIMDNATAKEPVVHGSHHDLESVYWLLVWMILRHTKHSHPKKDLACSTIFDGSVETKSGWVSRPTPVPDTNEPLFELTDRLRDKVWLQSLPPKKNTYSSAPAYAPLTYENVCAIFREWLDTPGWPTDDKAIPFKLPDPDPSKAGGSQSLYKTAGSQQKGSGSKKRSNDGPIDDEPRAGGSDGTGVPSGTRVSKRAKTKLTKLNLNLAS